MLQVPSTAESSAATCCYTLWCLVRHGAVPRARPSQPSNSRNFAKPWTRLSTSQPGGISGVV